MKLYNIKPNSNIRVIDNINIPINAPDIVKGQILKFHHIDGMYSYCTNSHGEVCHLSASADVEVVK